MEKNQKYCEKRETDNNIVEVNENISRRRSETRNQTPCVKRNKNAILRRKGQKLEAQTPDNQPSPEMNTESEPTNKDKHKDDIPCITYATGDRDSVTNIKMETDKIGASSRIRRIPADGCTMDPQHPSSNDGRMTKLYDLLLANYTAKITSYHSGTEVRAAFMNSQFYEEDRAASTQGRVYGEDRAAGTFGRFHLGDKAAGSNSRFHAADMNCYTNHPKTILYFLPLFPDYD